MYRIGEFSRIGRVTIETLRHYDAIGLLKPAQVDQFTGHRFYTANQLVLLNRILALKEVGLSLDEIGRILQDKLSNEELRGMLKAQLVQAESDMQAAEVRRERILTHLNHLLHEENMPTYEITLKPVDVLTVATIRETIPTVEQIPQRLGELFTTIAEWLQKNKVAFSTPITIYHDEAYAQENVDTECAFIVHNPKLAHSLKPESPIVIRQLDAMSQMATTIVADNFLEKAEGLAPAYHALGQWITEHGYHIVASPRELLHGTPENGDLTAEIQFPVAKNST